MSFQAYLDNIAKKTGRTPRELVDQAHGRGFDASPRATQIRAWLAEEYGLGRGHGMALVHVITKGDTISTAHGGSGGTHADPSNTLWLDGAATNPNA